MEGRPRKTPEQDWMLTQGRRSGECQGLKSDIYFSLSVWHSTSITKLSSRELSESTFQLNNIMFTSFDSS